MSRAARSCGFIKIMLFILISSELEPAILSLFFIAFIEVLSVLYLQDVSFSGSVDLEINKAFVRFFE